MEKTRCRLCRQNTETAIHDNPGSAQHGTPICAGCGACKCTVCVEEATRSQTKKRQESILIRKEKTMLFRELNEIEEKEFRNWARENYTPLDIIKGIWPPVVQDECTKMNREKMIVVPDEVDDSDD